MSAGGCCCVVGGWFGTVPPPPCPVHSFPILTMPVTTTIPVVSTGRYEPAMHGPATVKAFELSDADVERIAQRVAEILRGVS